MASQKPERIVSLIASATEILCALGLTDQLVGISHECDYPAEIVGLPVLSEPKIDTQQSGGEIDKAVRSLVRDGLSVYTVLEELLAELKPDLIVTQDQCEVCAVSLKDVEAACSVLTGTETRICTLHPDRLDDIYKDFQMVGEAAGVAREAARLVEQCQEALAGLHESVAQRALPTVACVEWLDPPMIAGGWIPELVNLAGGRPVIVTEPQQFKTVDWAEIIQADPDYLVFMPCGYEIRKTAVELAESEIASRVREMRATRQGHCYIADGNAFFNRPGPRIVDSTRILAGLLHPEVCPVMAGAVQWA